jgi:hypothetical protein
MLNVWMEPRPKSFFVPILVSFAGTHGDPAIDEDREEKRP